MDIKEGGDEKLSESKMSDIIKASVDGIRSFTDVESVVGAPIQTPSGVTVIPISKVTMGIATGGVDYSTKKLSYPQNFGGGGGTALSITPIAFLTIDRNSEINLINLSSVSETGKITELIENAPDIISKIKSLLS